MCNAAVRCGSKDVQSFTWMNQQYYNVHKFMTIFVKILSLLNRFSSVYIILFLVPSKRHGQRKNNYNFAFYFHCLFLTVSTVNSIISLKRP